MALLELKDLTVSYGNVLALHGISLQVESGEVVALLGSNGAGKTTTLRTIAGLQRSQTGSVWFLDRDITHEEAHQVVRMGLTLVPEGRRVFARLTVAENLRLGGYVLRNQPDELSDRRNAIYRVFPRLQERQEQLAGTLSGGEQQMLAIARALMSRPKLLALDEPSLGLSPILARRILKIVRRIADQSVGVLLVEQNARQALRIADRAYVLETGTIALQGSAAELAADDRINKAYLGGFDPIPGEDQAAGHHVS